MATKRIEIEVTRKAVIEVDTTSDIVQEYDDDDELVSDLVGYEFRMLPVIGDGVKVIENEITGWEHEVVKQT